MRRGFVSAVARSALPLGDGFTSQPREMQAQNRPLANLRWMGIPHAGGPFHHRRPWTSLTLNFSPGCSEMSRHEGSTRLEIIGLRCAGRSRRCSCCPPQIESLFDGSRLLGVAIVVVRSALGAVARSLWIYASLLTSEIRGEKSPVPSASKADIRPAASAGLPRIQNPMYQVGNRPSASAARSGPLSAAR